MRLAQLATARETEPGEGNAEQRERCRFRNAVAVNDVGHRSTGSRDETRLPRGRGVGGPVISFRSDLGNRERVGIKSTGWARRIGQRIEPVDIVGIEDEASAILLWIEADHVQDE